MPIARVQLPDGRIGRFEVPEGTTPDQVTSFANSHFSPQSKPEKPGVLEDVAKSLAFSAIPRAAVATPMWLGDTANLLTKGVTYAGSKAYNALADKPLTKEQEKEITSAEPFFGSQDATNWLEKQTGVELYDPKTRIGKLTDQATQFAIGNKAAGGKVLSGAISGAASEAAGQMTEGTKYEPLARLSAAVLGSVGADKASKWRSNAGEQAFQATKNVPKADMVAAKLLMEDAKSIGIEITPAEALAQVTGDKNQPLLKLQRSVEEAPNTGAEMSARMAERPAQNQQAFDDYMKRGVGEPANYPAIPSQTQKTAEQAVKGVEQQRTMATSPYYDDMRQDFAPTDEIQGLIDQIDGALQSAPSATRAQLESLRKDLMLHTDPTPDAKFTVGGNNNRAPVVREEVNNYFTGQTTRRPVSDGLNIADSNTPQQKMAFSGQRYDANLMPIPDDGSGIKTNVSDLDAVRKIYRDRIEAPAINATSLEKTVSAQVKPYVDKLNKIMESASPNFVQGKAIHQANTPAVDAINASPVGKLAQSNPMTHNAITSQFDELVRSDSARPQDVAAAVKTLAAVNPEAPQNLLAAGLRLEWEKATKALQTGENQMGGAKFAANVGTDKVRAGLGALPGGPEALRGFDMLMEVFGAQGKRMPGGSPTTEKSFLHKQMEKGGIVGTVSKPISAISDAVDDFRHAKANKQLLEVMTSPDGIQKLQELAKVGASSPRGRELTRALMLGAQGYEDGQPEPQAKPPAARPAKPPPAAPVKPQASAKPMPTKRDMLASSLAKAEGVRNEVYTDTTGHRTIGVGFNMDDKSARERWKQAGVQTPFEAAYSGKAKLPQEDIDRLMLASKLGAEKDAKALVPNFDRLSKNRQDALVHMAYQLGANRLQKFKPTLELINRGNYAEAAERLKGSKYARQTPARVKRLAEMLAKDVPYGG